jgi:hypothetical protein
MCNRSAVAEIDAQQHAREEMAAESRGRLVGGEESLAAGAALGAKTGAALGFAGLFVELAYPHFFLDPASLDQLAEAADGLLGRFFVSQRQLNHSHSWN